MSRDALEGDKGSFIFLWWMFAIRAWAAFAFPSNDYFRGISYSPRHAVLVDGQ